jgi:hypothetical protein
VRKNASPCGSSSNEHPESAGPVGAERARAGRRPAPPVFSKTSHDRGCRRGHHGTDRTTHVLPWQTPPAGPIRDPEPLITNELEVSAHGTGLPTRGDLQKRAVSDLGVHTSGSTFDPPLKATVQPTVQPPLGATPSRPHGTAPSEQGKPLAVQTARITGADGSRRARSAEAGDGVTASRPASGRTRTRCTPGLTATSLRRPQAGPAGGEIPAAPVPPAHHHRPQRGSRLPGSGRGALRPAETRVMSSRGRTPLGPPSGPPSGPLLGPSLGPRPLRRLPLPSTAPRRGRAGGP